MHRQNVAITLDPTLLLRSRSLAAQQGKSLSQLLEELLRKWLEQQGPSDEELENAIETFIEQHEQRESAKVRKREAAPPRKARK